MDLALWIVAGSLAVLFLISGLVKLALPKDRLEKTPIGKWSEDFGAGTVKFIGAMEAAGAVGLVLPAVTGVAPVLVPLAAVGLAVLMTGAAVVHVRRGEAQAAVMALVYVAVIAFVAWGRFAVEPFGA